MHDGTFDIFLDRLRRQLDQFSGSQLTALRVLVDYQSAAITAAFTAGCPVSMAWPASTCRITWVGGMVWTGSAGAVRPIA